MAELQRALVMGEFCLDVILSEPASVPVLGVPVWAGRTEIRLGGSASYTAQGLRSLGLDVTVNSYAGQDWMTDHFMEGLAEQGIRLNQVLRSTEIVTPVCTCVVERGKKRFVGCSPFAPYPAELIETTPVDFQLIYFGGFTLYPELWQGSLARLFARAKPNSLVILDTQFLPVPVDSYRQQAFTWENLKDVDVLLANRAESLAFTGCKDTREATLALAALGPKTVVIKQGGEGCLALSGNRWLESRAKSVEVINPVGGGDIFGASFAYGCLQGWDMQACCDFANTCAAYFISHTGCQLPAPSAVWDFIQKINASKGKL